MKFADSVLAMVGDFAAMKRTPDYTPSPHIDKTESTKEPEKITGPRRHSLLISVGTEEVPRLARTRSESFCASATTPAESKLYEKTARRVSAPCISTSGASAALRKRLQKMRDEKSTESDEHALREQSESEDESPKEQTYPRKLSTYRL